MVVVPFPVAVAKSVAVVAVWWVFAVIVISIFSCALRAWKITSLCIFYSKICAELDKLMRTLILACVILVGILQSQCCCAKMKNNQFT